MVFAQWGRVLQLARRVPGDGPRVMSFSREAAVPRPRTRGAAPVLVGALLAALFAGASALSSQELELRPHLPPWGDPGSAPGRELAADKTMERSVPSPGTAEQ